MRKLLSILILSAMLILTFNVSAETIQPMITVTGGKLTGEYISSKGIKLNATYNVDIAFPETELTSDKYVAKAYTFTLNSKKSLVVSAIGYCSQINKDLERGATTSFTVMIVDTKGKILQSNEYKVNQIFGSAIDSAEINNKNEKLVLNKGKYRLVIATQQPEANPIKVRFGISTKNKLLAKSIDTQVCYNSRNYGDISRAVFYSGDVPDKIDASSVRLKSSNSAVMYVSENRRGYFLGTEAKWYTVSMLAANIDRAVGKKEGSGKTKLTFYDAATNKTLAVVNLTDKFNTVEYRNGYGFYQGGYYLG